jgi:hypothetical protein
MVTSKLFYTKNLSSDFIVNKSGNTFTIIKI